MNVLDALIIILLIIGIILGIKRGFIKETVLLLGLAASLVAAFYIRIPVSTWMYKNLPFISFNGIWKGVSALNILVYELVAFLLVFLILSIVLKLLLKVSGLIEKILKATIILGIFSKIGGAVVGFIESYLIIFITLFILNLPFLEIKGLDESKYGKFILDNTPIATKVVSKTRNVIIEIENLSDTYFDDKTIFNEKAIELFLKYDIITPENLNVLREKGKIS